MLKTIVWQILTAPAATKSAQRKAEHLILDSGVEDVIKGNIK